METKTEVKATPDAQAPNGMDSIVQSGGSSLDIQREAIFWTKARVDLLKRNVCPSGVTDDEFAVFLEQCKRTQLDPLIKEAFCVPRRVKVERPNPHGGRPIDEWITRHEFQAAESGMAARADRFPDFEGVKAAGVYEGDQIEIDADAGTVQHKYKPNAKDRGKLIGAWARVYRRGRFTPVEWLDYDDYVQLTREGKPTAQWGARPETMLVKCARAAGWRRAYPNVFGGVYIEEEEPFLERVIGVEPASPEREKHAGKSRTERLEQKIGKPAPTSAPPAPSPDAGGPAARFGPAKGKALAGLATGELEHLLVMGRQSIGDSPGAKWVPTVQTNLVEIEAELAKRQAAHLAKMATRPEPEDAEIDESPPGLPPSEQGPGEDRTPGEDG